MPRAGFRGREFNAYVFRGRAFEKYGVNAQIEQRYEYKNAADMFMRSEMTDAHRDAARQAMVRLRTPA